MITAILGIIACIFTAKANTAYQEGKWEEFKNYAKTSAICLWTGLGSFILGAILLVLVWTAGGVGEAFWEGYYGTADTYTPSGEYGDYVYLDGSVINIPITYEELATAGYTLASSDWYDTLAGNDFGLYQIINGDGEYVCWGWFENRSPESALLTECRIIGIDVDYNCDNYETFKTSKGLGFFNSEEDYIKAYGEPDYERADYDRRTLYWYYEDTYDRDWNVLEVTFEGDMIYDIDVDYK